MKILLALLVFLTAASSSFADDSVTGQAMVRDASTIVVSNARFRLEAIIPAEEAQSCGSINCSEAAKASLEAFIDGRNVSCSKSRRLGHGYFLGKCSSDGHDLGEHLLSEGLAKPDTDASEVYRLTSEQAKTAHKGLWQSGI